jgi:hypothetical protein
MNSINAADRKTVAEFEEASLESLQKAEAEANKRFKDKALQTNEENCKKV